MAGTQKKMLVTVSRFNTIIPSAIDAATFRKCIEGFGQSAVSFIIGCILLMLSTKDAPKNKIHHQYTSTYGLDSAFRRTSFSISALNRTL